MRTNYSIRMIPRTKTFIVCYSRPSFYGGNWKHYTRNGRFIEHTTWDDAFNWLVARNNGNVTDVLLRLVDHYMPTAETVAEHVAKMQAGIEGNIDGTLFAAICDAHAAHKDELRDGVQMFYFLRGVLYQWCIDHNESVMDMEDMFLDDIRYIAVTRGLHAKACKCNNCTVQRANLARHQAMFTAPTLPHIDSTPGGDNSESWYDYKNEQESDR